MPPAQLWTFFRKHHCRDQERIERRILAIRQAIPAIGDRAVIEAKSTVVKVIVGLIRSLLEGIADLEEKIEGRRLRIRIFSSLTRCRERVPSWPRACWPPLARSESAMAVREKCRSTVASRR